ncbi:hypothetical protein GCM10009105_37610 [Dokdonella soli]|uniref:Uncharacterized protein n=1 Tax=Dokdonella soli TaxID=529810 RepID=A0ABP3UAT2_9GAMM
MATKVTKSTKVAPRKALPSSDDGSYKTLKRAVLANPDARAAYEKEKTEYQAAKRRGPAKQ